MKIVRGVALYHIPYKLQICYPHKIKIANTKVIEICNWTKIKVLNANQE